MRRNGMTDSEKKDVRDETLTYPVFFQNSELRANIIRWYPIQPGQKVLLVSEPCVALEKCLREMGAEVMTCGLNDEPTEADPVYDTILHVGVVDAGEEKAALAWQARFKRYDALLKEEGELLLAVPNRLGLKYFAGCQDDSYDAYFVGPEGYGSGMTKQALSKKEYEDAIRQAGYGEICYYYPYPDHLFPSAVFSDQRLPEAGELTDSIRNFDKDRYLFFDEAKVAGSLKKEGIFSSFANSFFIVCRKTERLIGKAAGGNQQSLEQAGNATGRAAGREDRVIYTKFSNERQERFGVRTDIVELGNGERLVRKYPLTEAAREHVQRMSECYNRLQKQAEGTKVRFCPVKIENGAAESPWVKGEALQHRLQKLLECGEKTAAEQLIAEYIEIVRMLVGKGLTDVDLIFPNILVDGDIWNVIDYEWSFEAEIPADWVIYRGLYYLSIELAGYDVTELAHLLALAGIKQEAAQCFFAWEVQFQQYITGGVRPISHMVDVLGRQVNVFAGNQSDEEREAVRRMNQKEKDAKKLFFHMDRVELMDGKAICCGWACAKTGSKEYIPVHIAIFDEDGNPIGRGIERSMRADVAEVLKVESDFPYWGFNASWSPMETRAYTLRLQAGRCQQEILLKELSLEKRERN